MVRLRSRPLLYTLGSCLVCLGLTTTAQAVNWFRPYVEESQPDVFYNYYVPGNGGQTPAAMYPSPYPTPPLVGHTYFTYQPWMPHEQMYKHHYTQHQYYDNGMGMNRTKVKWSYPPVRTALQNTRNWLTIPR